MAWANLPMPQQKHLYVTSCCRKQSNYFNSFKHCRLRFDVLCTICQRSFDASFKCASALSFCPYPCRAQLLFTINHLKVFYSYFSTIYLLITFHLPGNPRLLSYPCRTLPVLFLAFHSFTLSICLFAFFVRHLRHLRHFSTIL